MAMANSQARMRPESPILTRSDTAPMVQKLVLFTTAPMMKAMANEPHSKIDRASAKFANSMYFLS